jgi:hypothetical protein
MSRAITAHMSEPEALSDLDDWTDVDASSSHESDADTDRWEGLLERAERSPLADNALATEEDLLEDARVQSALAQSVVSTLSLSARSELRLSFPDPILVRSVHDTPRTIEDTVTETVVPGDTASPADSILSLDAPRAPLPLLLTLPDYFEGEPDAPAPPLLKKPTILGSVHSWQASTMFVLPHLMLRPKLTAPLASRS